MSKAAYGSDFRENTNFCPQRDSNLGPLAQQGRVLPLDYCDLLYRAYVEGQLQREEAQCVCITTNKPETDANPNPNLTLLINTTQ